MSASAPALPVRLVPVRYESPRVQALVHAFGVEMAVRYDEDPSDPGSSMSSAAAEDFDTPSGIFLLAVGEDGEDVGCGGLRTLEPGVGELKRMYVVPEARGHGAGSALLAALVAQAQRQGLTRLLLETGTEQPEALRLYERSGWTRVAPYGSFRDDPRSVCFARDVPPAPPVDEDEPAG